MDKEKLIQAMLNEADGQKAKAIADVIAAETEKEAKIAELSSRERISENECEAKKNEVEAKKLEAEARENSARIEAEAREEVAKIEAEVESAKIDSEEKRSKKDRILGIFKVVGTVFVALFTGFVTIFNARSVMKFEETGTIRTKAWTGVKPDKTQEIK